MHSRVEAPSVTARAWAGGAGRQEVAEAPAATAAEDGMPQGQHLPTCLLRQTWDDVKASLLAVRRSDQGETGGKRLRGTVQLFRTMALRADMYNRIMFT